MNADQLYRQAPGLNWSRLKTYSVPIQAKWIEDNGRKDSPSMAWGRLVHAMILEPQTVNDLYAVYDGRRGTKAHKEWLEEHPGVECVKPDEWRTATQASIMVRSHDAVAKLLADGFEAEVPIAWTCPETGIDMKAKLDAVRPRERVLIDVKTTRSIEARTFGAHAAKLGYHGQLAHYAAACTHGLDWTPKRVVIIAVESAGPFDVAVFDFSDDDLYAGEMYRAELLETFQRCQELQQWPGRYPAAVPMALPVWAFPDSNDLTDLNLTY